MKRSELFEIAIKIFGFAELLKFLTLLEDVINSYIIQYMENTHFLNDLQDDRVLLFNAINLSYLLLTLILALFLIYRSRLIAQKFSPEKYDNEAMAIPLDRQSILHISFVVIALFLIIWTLPGLVNDTLNQIKMVRYNMPRNFKETNYLWYAASKLIMGVVLAIYSGALAKWLTRNETQIAMQK